MSQYSVDKEDGGGERRARVESIAEDGVDGEVPDDEPERYQDPVQVNCLLLLAAPCCSLLLLAVSCAP